MTLGDFLKQAGTNRAPGNCSTLAADWCVALGHPDFAAAWRDTTGSAAEGIGADELLRHWDAAIGDALPPASEAYEPGDIAVVSMFGYAAGAIFTGERWAFWRPRGLFFAPIPSVAIMMAWRPEPVGR